MEYPKIETLFDRDPKTFSVTDTLRLPEFGLINSWLVTEKIDGTNVRVHLSADGLQFGGRTDNAQMPVILVNALRDTFSEEQVRAAFDPDVSEVWLFGEGYGAGIQGGGKYSKSARFRLFDVKVGDWWLNWSQVADVATKLGVETVPVLRSKATLSEAIALVPATSAVATIESDAPQKPPREGVVCRTEPLLFTRRGDRLMWKLKNSDYKEGKR